MVARSLMTVRTTDVTGQLRGTARVGTHQRVAEIRSDLRETLELPSEDRGQPIVYGVFNDTQRLRLGDADIIGERARENDLMRMVPEITAAGTPGGDA